MFHKNNSLISNLILYIHKVPELTLSQQLELTPAKIGHNVHAHPTLSEVLHEAAKAVTGEALHA